MMKVNCGLAGSDFCCCNFGMLSHGVCFVLNGTFFTIAAFVLHNRRRLRCPPFRCVLAYLIISGQATVVTKFRHVCVCIYKGDNGRTFQSIEKFRCTTSQLCHMSRASTATRMYRPTVIVMNRHS